MASPGQWIETATLPASAPADRSAPPPVDPRVSRLKFTGREDEYFRIWIVNLFLTAITFGIYSAWAKVRKTRYFWQNTRCEGHVFEFHGNPVAILRGRIIAVILIAAYTWSFEFSKSAGLITIALLIAGGPWLFMKAQQFKFRNTSWSGLRFGFAASVKDGYRVVMPILALWFSSTILTAFINERVFSGPLLTLLAITSIGTLIAIPAMHHRLKSFQHNYATYGERRFSFEPALKRFYGVYARGLGLLVLVWIFGGIVVGLILVPLATGRTQGPPSHLMALLSAGVVALLAYVFVWPYLAARLQQVVWANTKLDDVRFHTDIEAMPLFKLVFRNVAFTLLTAGLYWPFATVALARYRIECMRIEADTPLSFVAAGTAAGAVTAVGDATAESLGLDLGL
jgi:uncharacterized membrane protein YjgN (DUF898 family)